MGITKNYCTVCLVEIEDDDHYMRKFHVYNGIRKLNRLEPISEIEHEKLLLDDECFDISEDSIGYLAFTGNTVNMCLFCETTNDSVEHYHFDHCLSLEEIRHIKTLTCYECKAGFFSKKALKMHLETGRHNTYYFDGTTLVCNNIKLLKVKSKENLARFSKKYNNK